MRSHWLARIETLGTTAVVLMVGSMMVWYESVERGGRLALVIGSAVSLYVAALVAAVTGLVIGTAHWAALRVWLGLTQRREA